MLRIVLAAGNADSLARLAAGLNQTGKVELFQASSAAKAMDMVENRDVDLVVVGEELADMRPLEFVSQVVTCRPMINTAMVSNLSPDDFHEATEGLGVLMQLSPNPSAADAAALLKRIEELSALFGRYKQGVARQ